MIGNLNENSLFTQAYFTMLTTIHESKNYPINERGIKRAALRSDEDSASDNAATSGVRFWVSRLR